MIPYKQLSLEEVFQDCLEKFENDKPAFLSLLEQHIDLDEMIPASFGGISMHQRAEPVNTLCKPFCGR